MRELQRKRQKLQLINRIVFKKILLSCRSYTEVQMRNCFKTLPLTRDFLLEVIRTLGRVQARTPS